MYRQSAISLLIILSVFFTTANAATGVALVHGKGVADLANQQYVIDNYWGMNMINAVTKGGTVPSVIVHYDGTQAMWNAATAVAQQLVDFINTNNIDDLVIDTHSFGGVVIRWIFSNPDWDSNYPIIINATRWVNTIAAPQKGSEAADLSGTLSGSWLTGWILDLVGREHDASTQNVTTDSMDYYNEHWLSGTSGRPKKRISETMALYKILAQSSIK